MQGIQWVAEDFWVAAIERHSVKIKNHQRT